MPKKYVLIQRFDRDNLPPGTEVYQAETWDYGLGNDDTRMTGVEHISVSRNPNGAPPFFTIPVSLLQEVAP